MTDLAAYNRSAHHAHCPCKDCIAFDCAVYFQEHPQAVQHWKFDGLERMLRAERDRDLNWSIASGHCILCGGTVAWMYNQMEHYQIERHNTREANGTIFTSLLLHKSGSMFAVYKRILTSRPMLIDWASGLMKLNPEKCVAIASREHEEWLEVRLGYTGLEDESWEQRNRRLNGLNAPSRGENSRRSDSPTATSGGQLQVTASVAR